MVAQPLIEFLPLLFDLFARVLSVPINR